MRPHGEVVQKKKRPGALDYDIIDAHGNQVYTDRIVPVRNECDFELGPHSIG